MMSNLVGGFNPAEKYVSQLGNLTQMRGEHAKKDVKSPGISGLTNAT